MQDLYKILGSLSTYCELKSFGSTKPRDKLVTSQLCELRQFAHKVLIHVGSHSYYEVLEKGSDKVLGSAEQIAGRAYIDVQGPCR